MGIDKGGFRILYREMTGLLSPGIFAAFVMGFFWKGQTQPALYLLSSVAL